MGRIDDDGSGADAADFLGNLLEVFGGAGRSIGLNPFIAVPLDGRNEWRHRLQLTEEMARPAAALQSIGKRHATRKRFPAAAARTIHAKQHRFSGHAFFPVP
jgi:hypothetical protein